MRSRGEIVEDLAFKDLMGGADCGVLCSCVAVFG